jgi:hypothetical protein
MIGIPVLTYGSRSRLESQKWSTTEAGADGAAAAIGHHIIFASITRSDNYVTRLYSQVELC